MDMQMQNNSNISEFRGEQQGQVPTNLVASNAKITTIHDLQGYVVVR